MSDHAVREDNSTLSKLDQWLHRLERWLNLAAGILVLFIVLFSVINIVGRGVFNRPFNAYFDLMGQSVPLIAFSVSPSASGLVGISEWTCSSDRSKADCCGSLRPS